MHGMGPFNKVPNFRLFPWQPRVNIGLKFIKVILFDLIYPTVCPIVWLSL